MVCPGAKRRTTKGDVSERQLATKRAKDLFSLHEYKTCHTRAAAADSILEARQQVPVAIRIGA